MICQFFLHLGNISDTQPCKSLSNFCEERTYDSAHHPNKQLNFGHLRHIQNSTATLKSTKNSFFLINFPCRRLLSRPHSAPLPKAALTAPPHDLEPDSSLLWLRCALKRRPSYCIFPLDCAAQSKTTLFYFALDFGHCLPASGMTNKKQSGENNHHSSLQSTCGRQLLVVVKLYIPNAHFSFYQTPQILCIALLS